MSLEDLSDEIEIVKLVFIVVWLFIKKNKKNIALSKANFIKNRNSDDNINLNDEIEIANIVNKINWF